MQVEGTVKRQAIMQRQGIIDWSALTMHSPAHYRQVHMKTHQWNGDCMITDILLSLV